MYNEYTLFLTPSYPDNRPLVYKSVLNVFCSGILPPSKFGNSNSLPSNALKNTRLMGIKGKIYHDQNSAQSPYASACCHPMHVFAQTPGHEVCPSQLMP
ncbi:hypothetical protein EYC80_010005 [Monilinia laxa]|uniref:Uncharacterized protein n=1 Tax=Monilinia laxa TaxID=61186 RepID=A0A5N6JRC7_MONLA|nr:hypothetical protein EYC80_010005 [Monilinia laxa]